MSVSTWLAPCLRWQRCQLVKGWLFVTRGCTRGSRLTANGLERQLDLLGIIGSVGGLRPASYRFSMDRTLSRVVARQLGLLTQVRPTHSALCGFMYNVI